MLQARSSNGNTVGKMGQIREDPKKNRRIERPVHRFTEYKVLPHSTKLENSL